MPMDPAGNKTDCPRGGDALPYGRPVRTEARADGVGGAEGFSSADGADRAGGASGGADGRGGRGHPLGPLWRMVPLDGRLTGRLYAAGVFIAVAALFAVAYGLHPDGIYHGAHQQLGLPPCGFVVMTGLPCPTCGMTTAFAYTIHGQWLRAVVAQPAGFAAALVCLAIGLLAAWATITARRPSINWYRINPTHVVWVCCGLFVAAWGVKIVLYLLENGSAGIRY